MIKTTPLSERVDEFGNRKMVPLKCRHGAGLAPGDYINMVLEGQYATVIEKETKHNLMRGEEQEPEGKPSFLVDYC